MATRQTIQAVLVQEEFRYHLSEVGRVTGLEPGAFIELVQCEVLAVVQEAPDVFLVTEQVLLKSKHAARLARDFELSPQGIALAMRLLERIEELESSLARKPGAVDES